MTRYTVKAKRSKPGWELWISSPDGHVGVTEARKLTKAEQAARDYIETLTDKKPTGDEFEIVPDLGDLEKAISCARVLQRRAADETKAAAVASRGVVLQLLDEGLSGDEAAVVLGISKGRVSQLAKGSERHGRPRRVLQP